MNPDVTIAVVGHEHGAYLERALSAIYASEMRRSFEVIFVDNDSRLAQARVHVLIKCTVFGRRRARLRSAETY